MVTSLRPLIISESLLILTAVASPGNTWVFAIGVDERRNCLINYRFGNILTDMHGEKSRKDSLGNTLDGRLIVIPEGTAEIIDYGQH